MNTENILKEMERAKTWDSKVKYLRELNTSDNPLILDEICSRFLKTSSAKFRNEAIYIIELIAGKHKGKFEDKILPNYNKFLKKYKIKTTANFWFRDIPLIENYENIFPSIEDKVNENYKNEIPKFSFEYKFNQGKNIIGYIQIRFGMTTKFDFSSISYGIYTSLRDYSDENINCHPNTQFHITKGNFLSYKTLEKLNIPFRFPTDIVAAIYNYFKSNQNLYDELNQLDLTNLLESNGVKNIGDVLGLINVALNEGNRTKAKKIASIGVDKLSNKSVFKKWGKYLTTLANE